MRVVCPASENCVTPGGAKKASTRFPTNLLAKTSSRLYWLALLVLVSTFLLFALRHFLQPELRAFEQSLLFRIAIPLLAVPSLVVIFIHRSGLLPPRRMLELGIVFAIVASSGIALLEFARTQLPVQTALGISGVPMWILAFGIFVPNSPIRTFLAALISACTVPAAYVFSRSVTGIPAWELSDLMLWLIPCFLMAGWTYFLSRDLYQIEMDINVARETGSYSLEKLLGRGGMGEVWAARHRALRSGAAVKLIRPEALTERTGREAHVIRRRFEQEARATARLRSPHTVALHDFGLSDDGSFYYAMELLEGLELETLISRFGPQPASRVVNILAQVCDSLAEAHYHGLIHRDIKPSNVFLARLGLNFDFVKVLDFGLVKLDNGASTRLTLDGTTAGTPAYMAPELASGLPYDARVDIYGLGCVGYFLLTGAPVFDEPSPVAVALAHVQKQPVPPSQRTELGVPLSLERTILRCLAKDPADRPQSAVELARLLDDCRDVGIWTHENAESWWRAHLPDSFAVKDAPIGEALSVER